MLISIILIINISFSCEAYSTYHFTVFGTPKYSKDFQYFDYVNPDAPKRGEIRFANVGNFDSLNPFTIKGQKAPNMSLIFDSLMVRSLDELYSYYGLIAEEIDASADLNEITVKLRQHARWHDGKPLTADDVVFTFETLKNKGSPNLKIAYRNLKKIVKLSDYQVRFVFDTINDKQQVIYVLSQEILPKHFFADKDFEKCDRIPILASGPYKISDVKLGQSITYERVDDYWGKDLPVMRGSFNFHKVIYDNYKDESIAVEALKSGEYDIREENVSRNWRTAYNFKAKHTGQFMQKAFPKMQPPNFQAFFLNTRKPMLQDINLRKALFLALDYDWMNKFLFYNLYKRTKSTLEGTIFASSGIPTGKELAILKSKSDIDTQMLNNEFLFYETEASSLVSRNNLKLAKETLQNAGYFYVKNKLYHPVTRNPVVLEFLTESPMWIRATSSWIVDLQKLGITLNIRRVDFSQFQQRLNNFDFDIIAASFSPTLIPGGRQRQLWHSKSNVTGGDNLAGVDDPFVDRLIEKLENSSDEEDIIATSRALDRYLLWNYYFITNWHSNEFRYALWNKMGIPEKSPEYESGIWTWWQK